MIRFRKYSIIKFSYILIDIAFISLSLLLACWMRESTLPFSATFYNLFFSPLNPYRFIFLFWVLVTLFVNNSYGLYQTKRELFESVEIWQVTKSVFLSSLVTIVAIYLAKNESFPRSVLILGDVFVIFSFSLWRIGKRFFVEYLVSRGYNNFNALIIGAGKVGLALTKEIEKRPGLGVRVVGFLDDFKVDNPEQGPRVLGKISDFIDVARREFINKIFITVHHDSRVFLQLLEQAKELGIRVRVVPQGFDLISGEFLKYNIGFIPILEYYDEENLHKQVGKRLFDAMSVFFLLILIVPVLIAIAILIKLDSPGPVFYFSRRYGRRGKIFTMYKFRSMVHNADQIIEQLRHKNEVDGPIFKIKEDPRATKIGRFLRKYSLDELPQLINVLKGDMSLVGPRPFPTRQIEKEDLRQLKRLEVRPGITGLWQIRGRSDISFGRLLKWDIWYINNWSFGLDMNILFQTIPVVIKGKGAY